MHGHFGVVCLKYFKVYRSNYMSEQRRDYAVTARMDSRGRLSRKIDTLCVFGWAAAAAAYARHRVWYALNVFIQNVIGWLSGRQRLRIVAATRKLPPANVATSRAHATIIVNSITKSAFLCACCVCFYFVVGVGCCCRCWRGLATSTRRPKRTRAPEHGKIESCIFMIIL